MPNITQVETSEGIKKIDYEHLANQPIISNPNLLDNWYFADPIDQREGYLAPPGAPYYSDTGLTAQAGRLDVYTAANYGDGTYGTITVSGTTCYIDWTQAARGYIGRTYSVDRWYIREGTTLALDTDGIVLTSSAISGSRVLQQVVEGIAQYVGKEMTFSALLKKVSSPVDGVLISVGFSDRANTISVPRLAVSETVHESADAVLVCITFSVPQESNYKYISANIGFAGDSQTASALGETFTLQAAKLELGSTQTLAHQDANGSWVLNDPPPDRALELLRCQRYFFAVRHLNTSAGNIVLPLEITGVAGNPGGHYPNFAIPTPVELRATPTISYRNIGLRLKPTLDTSTNTDIANGRGFSVVNRYSGGVNVGVNSGMTLDMTAKYYIYLRPGGYIRLSADL